MTNNLYAVEAEIQYRQERLRGSARRLSRKHRRHERYEYVSPAGDARA